MDRAPLFFFSLFGLMGALWALCPHWALVLPTCALFLFGQRRRVGLGLFVSFLTLTLVRCPPSLLSLSEKEGTGTFVLSQVKVGTTSFGNSTQWIGTLEGFEGLPNIPCTVQAKKGPERGSRFSVTGVLSQTRRGNFSLKASEWTIEEEKGGIARWRAKAKQGVHQLIKRRFSQKGVAPFLSAMMTGEVTDRMLLCTFQKVGLGHLLAISGFHFALFATLVGGLFRLFFSPRITALLLIGSITALFFFLGSTPSISRAYGMILLFLIGILLGRRSDSLNLLGSSLLLEILLSPFSLFQVGMQLSYLATVGIFLFYQPTYEWLRSLFPLRSKQEVRLLSLLDRHFLVIGQILHKGIALQGAILATTIPATLFHFGSLPLLSLPYNLLVTPLLCITLYALPPALLLWPLSPLYGRWVSYLLRLVENPPEMFNFQLVISSLPPSIPLSLTAILLFLGLTKRERRGENGVVFLGDRSSAG